jgi:glutathione S-transferase
MDWAFTFQSAMRNVFWGLIRTPPEKRDHKAIEEGRVQSARLAEVLERNLEKKPYVAGDAFTMGDIPIGCEVQRWMRVPIERPALPRVQAWFDRLRERAPFRQVVDIPLT